MPLRILTANLYSGRADPAAFASALAATEPDIVAIQELAPNAAAVLADWGESRLLDPNEETTGMALAVRARAHLTRLEFPYRDPVLARFDGGQWGFGEIEVVNTHLVNPIARPFRVSKRLRRAELAALEGVMKNPVATRLVVGDLNSSPAWPLYRRLTDIAIDGAVAAGKPKRTWGYFPNSPPMLRIDHVFVQGARCISTDILKIAGADHRALVVDVEPIS
ncbi:MAG: endonuclease/exonuclease/phosphatase family protein [Acidimicrobiia bacterium]|nr:endonuclease/exonuclease/phosphatase family protein [Acidimicrobiia bacterium]